jgi:hypothetical protein
MDIKSVVETIDSFFGPIARIIGYITVIGGTTYAVISFIKKTVKNTRKKKEKKHIAIEVCPRQKPKVKCI